VTKTGTCRHPSLATHTHPCTLSPLSESLTLHIPQVPCQSPPSHAPPPTTTPTFVLSDDLEGPKHLSGHQLEHLRVTHRCQRHKYSSGCDGPIALGDAVTLQGRATPQQLGPWGVYGFLRGGGGVGGGGGEGQGTVQKRVIAASEFQQQVCMMDTVVPCSARAFTQSHNYMHCSQCVKQLA
jgi:hypothetical protein